MGAPVPAEMMDILGLATLVFVLGLKHGLEPLPVVRPLLLARPRRRRDSGRRRRGTRRRRLAAAAMARVHRRVDLHWRAARARPCKPAGGAARCSRSAGRARRSSRTVAYRAAGTR